MNHLGDDFNGRWSHADSVDEEMNKDHLLIKCKEVIESLNSEIEEERIAYKILNEESEYRAVGLLTLLYYRSSIKAFRC
jgi:hypothetical protein